MMTDTQLNEQDTVTDTPIPANQTPGSSRPADLDYSLVLFDGVCGLCNGFVDFVMPRDKSANFRFSPLQGETAKAYLTDQEIADLNTFVLVDKTGVHRRSPAMVRALRTLGGIWGVLGGLLWLIPYPLREIGYRLVAKNRYRMFGKHEACRMPTPEERERFLP